MAKAQSDNKAGTKRPGTTSTILNRKQVKQFSKAAKTFTGKATETRQAARQTLISLGINTQTGKLTKRYR